MKNKKQIVFYCATAPTVMIYKIAWVLKKNNYETILFTMCESDRFDHKFYSEAFDKIICSNFQFFKLGFKTIPYILKRGISFCKFLINMKLTEPCVIIGMSGVNWQLKLVHKHFFKKTPFVYFPYDILSHYLSSKENEIKKRPPEFEIQAEKYCFENCDGVMHKGDPDELNFIKGIVHKEMNLPKLQLSFLPYCSKEFSVPMNKDKLSKRDNEIHLVYIGFLFNDVASVKKFTKCFKKIMAQKIHIHIYTMVVHLSKDQEEDYIKDFFKQVSKDKYFHLHNSLGAKELIPEISQYDFGFWPVQECLPDEAKFSVGNKLASYFEAGLPFIYDDLMVFVDKFMSSNGLKISYDEGNLKNLKKRIKKINYKDLEKNVIKARKDFDMDKNFPRLQKFIEKVAKKKKSQQSL